MTDNQLAVLLASICEHLEDALTLAEAELDDPAKAAMHDDAGRRNALASLYGLAEWLDGQVVLLRS